METHSHKVSIGTSNPTLSELSITQSRNGIFHTAGTVQKCSMFTVRETITPGLINEFSKRQLHLSNIHWSRQKRYKTLHLYYVLVLTFTVSNQLRSLKKNNQCSLNTCSSPVKVVKSHRLHVDTRQLVFACQTQRESVCVCERERELGWDRIP